MVKQLDTPIDMSEKAAMKENKSTHAEFVSEKMECNDDSDVCEPAKLSSDGNELSPEVSEKMNQVFNNELILSEIMKRMPVKDRIKAKSVSSVFLRELNRRKFLQEEFITFRGSFSSEQVEKVKPLGLLDRDDINLTFVNVESFEDQPKEFWLHHRWKVQKVRFKGCGINFRLLQQVLENSFQNLLEISTAGCFFDDDSGWKNSVVENDPLDPIFRSTEPLNPKRGRGKLVFQKNVEGYVCRFMNHSANMFVYSDEGKVRSFVFEYPHRCHYIAFHGWNVRDVTLYNEVQLDASPNKLPGWSSFRSYLKNKDVDERSNPRWIMIDIQKIKHIAIQNVDPPFIGYITEPFH